MAADLSGKLRTALVIQRVVLAVFIGIWTLDKFLNPGHATGVYSSFYGISIGETGILVIAVLELLIVAAFLLGFLKTLSYGLVFLFHAVSTGSTWWHLIFPYAENANMVFWAAVPVLVAFGVQFALREHDTLALDDRLKAKKAGAGA